MDYAGPRQLQHSGVNETAHAARRQGRKQKKNNNNGNEGGVVSVCLPPGETVLPAELALLERTAAVRK